MTGNSNAKPWNVALSQVEPEERLYTDFKEEAKSMKLASNLKQVLMVLNSGWELTRSFIQTTNCGNSSKIWWHWNIRKNAGSLIVKFHLSTGVVLVQGSNFRKWRDEQYDKMRSRIDVIQADISSPGLSQNYDSNGKPECDGDTFPEKSSDRDTTGPGPNKDDDVTQLKLNDNDCQDQCNNDANVDRISIVTDRDSIDAEAAGISGNDNTCIYQNDTNDMITKLENAYIHMCDSVTESLNGIRAEIAEVKNEIRKLPVKIFDMVRKE